MRRKNKQVVLKVLKNEPVAREDDNILILLVCREMGFKLSPEQIQLINDLPRFSSIVRTRAKIQEQGRFLPPQDVWRQRRHFKNKDDGGPDADTTE